jgi:hypothetical protein
MLVRPIALVALLGAVLLSNAGDARAHPFARQMHALPTCTVAALHGIVQLQGAAGQRVGAATLTNRGSVACILRGTPRVTIVGQNGQTLPVRQIAGPRGPYGAPLGGIELIPGQRTDVPVAWGNYCGNDPGMIHLVMRLPRGGELAVYSGGFAGPTLPVPPCLGAGQQSTLGVGAFLPPAEDPASGVLNYYADINGRLYKDAYGLLTGPKSTFSAFQRGYADTAHVTVDLVATPLYRIRRNGAVYSCVGVHFRALKTNGTSRSYGGWYLTATRQSVNERLVPARSTIRVNGSLALPSSAVCAQSIP